MSSRVSKMINRSGRAKKTIIKNIGGKWYD